MEAQIHRQDYNRRIALAVQLTDEEYQQLDPLKRKMLESLISNAGHSISALERVIAALQELVALRGDREDRALVEATLRGESAGSSL